MPKKTVLKRIEHFTNLPLGTQLYRPTETHVKGYYFGGINPESKKSIMLISSMDVQTIHGEHVGDGEFFKPLFVDYNDACHELISNAKKNLKKVKKIYTKK